MTSKRPAHNRRSVIGLFSLPILGLLLCAGMYASVNTWPSIGAQGADILRRLVGDDAVARLEGAVFLVQDRLHQWQYQQGNKPDVPWEMPTSPVATPVPGPLPTLTPTLPVALVDQNSAQQIQAPSRTPVSTLLPEPTLTPTWAPGSIAVSGSLEGEGEWVPYITSAAGRTVAYRSFLQPDPERPYAIAAVVAFDLNATSLHYVLGIDEPYSEVPIDRPGTIDPQDLKPGILLAVFNGGFKGRHGHFGVCIKGTVVIPARPEMGTLAIYQDGTVRIGEWGSAITDSPEIEIWRQNGPLIIQRGQINPRVNENSIDYWGSTVDGAGVVPTWRSAVGISSGRNILYYVAGKDLTMPSLAQALLSAGVSEAIQLDINNYWVHFGTVSFDSGKPETLPLFKEMNENKDRYLYPYTRDFFYVTLKP